MQFTKFTTVIALLAVSQRYVAGMPIAVSSSTTASSDDATTTATAVPELFQALESSIATNYTIGAVTNSTVASASDDVQDKKSKIGSLFKGIKSAIDIATSALTGANQASTLYKSYKN